MSQVQPLKNTEGYFSHSIHGHFIGQNKTYVSGLRKYIFPIVRKIDYWSNYFHDSISNYHSFPLFQITVNLPFFLELISLFVPILRLELRPVIRKASLDLCSTTQLENLWHTSMFFTFIMMC